MMFTLISMIMLFHTNLDPLILKLNTHLHVENCNWMIDVLQGVSLLLEWMKLDCDISFWKNIIFGIIFWSIPYIFPFIKVALVNNN